LIGSGGLVRRDLLPRWSAIPDPDVNLPPPQILLPHLQRLLNEAIEKELRNRVIQKISKQQTRWLSPVFFIPKPDETFRKITDCSALNIFLHYPSFKMEDQRLLVWILC
jgi:hypothetical protein